MRAKLMCLALVTLAVVVSGRLKDPTPPPEPTEPFLEVSSVKCGPTNQYCGSAPATSAPDPLDIHNQPWYGHPG